MSLIYDYVWIWIGAAALLGFIAAWISRGITAKRKRRDAEMQRDVAQAELNQIRGELDSLYATQRRQKEALARAARANLEDLRERDRRLSNLTDELHAAREEIRDLRERPPVVSAETEEADKPDQLDAIADLKARNVYLEERVSDVEGKIHGLSKNMASSPRDDSKRAWQVGYLKTRVTALEDKLVEAQERMPVSAQPEHPVMNASQDEELARLRWRNRYLEGRLAYFEEAYSPEARQAPSLEGPASKALPEPSVEASDWQVADTLTDEDERGFAVPEKRHPSEAFLEVLERINDASAGEQDG
ncbi:hypothetical protein [Henriciella sp.]|uniref:hypothetical protein n=1 Tax=Henriciella sp. TaxID=1968823 RepID=UPI00260219C3|nr:hypothetical protein [Henriciella sp.]